VIYHSLNVFFYIQIPAGNLNTHLLFAFLITFLSGARKGRWRTIGILLAVVSLVALLYIQFNVWDLEERAGGMHSRLELAIALIIILLTMFSTWQEFGAPLLVVGCLFLLYAYFGYLLPEPLKAAPISFKALIENLCLNMEGIYGIILSVSANFIFLFLIFAALMISTGEVGFFHEVGKFIGSRVAITGSFTIPSMKKAGYRADQAAGIEAAASSGGPIIPPVMGVAAFIMAGIVGINYAQVIAVAFLPAFLYVTCCLCYVVFQARRRRVGSSKEKVDTGELVGRLPLFLTPLLLIIFLFIRGFSPLYVSFWACVTMIMLSLIKKTTRPSLGTLLEGFVKGARLGSQIAVSCAFLGMVVKVITMTGLGIVLPRLISNLCGGNLFLLLIFTGFVSIILGTGLPAATSYIMVAIVTAPALLGLGVAILKAHLFAFYFCNFSYITPPVALACVFASKLANASYIRTGFEAVKVGVGGFIIPFMIIWCPALLLDFSESVPQAVMKLVACFVSLFGLQIAIVGHYILDLKIIERVLFLFCTFLFMVSIYSGNMLFFGVGIIMIVGLTFRQYIKNKA
jgi:TRAP-type uncharacterized transport system fused permease subunit